MSDTTYAITPEDLKRAAWRGSLYTFGAALLTGLAMVLLGELIAELFLASLFVYAGIGWAAGTAMKHAFEFSEEPPARALALLYTLLGILIARSAAAFIMGITSGVIPLMEVIMATIEYTGMGMLYWFEAIFSFEDPVSSIIGLIAPFMALAVAWRSTTPAQVEVAY